MLTDSKESLGTSVATAISSTERGISDYFEDLGIEIEDYNLEPREAQKYISDVEELRDKYEGEELKEKVERVLEETQRYDI